MVRRLQVSPVISTVPPLLVISFFTNNRTKSSQTSYLLFRQGNAFAATITPPARLRRWTAAFFAAFALNHVWYMPVFFLSSSDRYGLLPLWWRQLLLVWCGVLFCWWHIFISCWCALALLYLWYARWDNMDAGCATIIFVHEDLAFVEQLKKAGVEVDSFVEPSR